MVVMLREHLGSGAVSRVDATVHEPHRGQTGVFSGEEESAIALRARLRRG